MIVAHFKFASFLFDVLGDINEIFQAKYSFVDHFWGHIENLRNFLVRELMKLENNDLSRFDYLAEFDQEKRSQFVVIFKHLILNLKVRFFSVSYSLNKKSIRNFLDYNNKLILNGALVDDGSRCGLSPLFDLFNIRLTPVTA